jgi:predicted RNA-binding Zn ribbon-like protein
MTKRNGDDGFLFLGNNPALDFLNTRPVPDDAPVELLPDFAAMLRWFRAAGLLSAGQAAGLQQEFAQSAQAERTVKAVRELREKLRQDVLHWETGRPIRTATVDELNRLMADHPMLTGLKRTGTALAIEQYFEARRPPDLFAPLAHHAAALFANVDWRKVRKCAHCVLQFHDTSKKGTRRWCSMQMCGNRLKVAAYAARQQGRSNAGRAVTS